MFECFKSCLALCCPLERCCFLCEPVQRFSKLLDEAAVVASQPKKLLDFSFVGGGWPGSDFLSVTLVSGDASGTDNVT